MNIEEACRILAPKTMTLEGIKESFKVYAKKHHPDAAGATQTSATAFMRGQEARDVLIKHIQTSGGASSAPGPVPGVDIHINLTVTLEELLKGEPVALPGGHGGECRLCSGSGKMAQEAEICLTCRGEGHIVISRGIIRTRKTCSDCGGTGETTQRMCSACDGSGVDVLGKGRAIKVPGWSQDGDVLAFAGQGGPGRNGGPRGRLVVRIQVGKHPHVARKGADLSVTARVSFADLCLGGACIVRGLDGAPHRLEIPPGFQPNALMVLDGQGMPRKEGGRGKMYVRLVPKVPSAELTPQQIAALKQWRTAETP